MSLIKDRFEQRDYNIYINCEQLLLTAAGGDAYEAEFQNVTRFYGCWFEPRELDTDLSVFTHNIPRAENVILPNVLAIAVFTSATVIVKISNYFWSRKLQTLPASS